MTDILSLDGYQIQTASNCLEAINAVESRPFDALIVDWKLPDEDADYMIPFIVERLPDSPVIVVTGLRDFDTAVRALRKGAYDFLLKPVNPDALRAVLRRVRERRENLLQLRAAEKKLLVQERLAAIGQMVAGLAHESRNAFQRCHACLETLALDLDSMPESLELVHKVQRALDDMHQLLEEVRDYSAPIILEKRECNLEALLRETWSLILATNPAEIEPEFSVDLDPDVDPSVSLDVTRIQQVVRNLLENARFACPEPGTVQVRVQRDDVDPQQLRIDFCDDGLGISEPEMEEVFEPFYTTKTRGTGLGLAICRRIVEAHRGTITADRSELGGARLTLRLPCERSSLRQAI